MEKHGVALDPGAHAEVFIVQRAEGGQPTAFRIARDLRQDGIATIVGESGRSMKSQMRSANASGAHFAVILGEDELARGVALVKDLREGGDQHETPLGDVVSAIRSAQA
jgi:histidyl-tRNA synthetase